MGLSFLVPAFLAGLAALAIPIIVHLRNRVRKDSVPFPSLMFLERIPYRTVQRQQLRHRLLFAARCLAIFLLVLAFARPFLGGDVGSAIGAAGAVERVIVVDRSWSMGYGDRWQRALDAAAEAAAELASGDSISLVAFGQDAEVVVESTTTPSEVVAALQALAVGSQTTSLAAGLRAARRILAESTLPNREVVLISDFQRVGWEETEPVDMPEGTRMQAVSLAEEAATNVAVTDVVLQREIAASPETDDLVLVTARLTNQGDEPVHDLAVTLEVADLPAQELRVDLEPNGSDNVRFEGFTASDAVVRGTVVAGSDALPGDNRFDFVVSPGQVLSVLVVEHERGNETDSLYLERALAIGSHPSFRVERATLAELRAADLEERALVVLNDAGVPDATRAELLASYVESGGGLLIALGELTDGPWSDRAETLVGRSVGELVDRGGDLGATLAYIDTDHQAFELFRAPNSGDFTSIPFYRYRALRPPSTSGVLARFDDGAVALYAHSLGAGRVLVWTTTLDRFWNEFARQPVYLPFVHQAAKYAAGYVEPRSSVPAGRPASVRELGQSVAAAAGQRTALEEGATLQVTPPAGAVFEVALRADAPTFTLEPGFYDLAYDGPEGWVTSTLAVNLDRGESDLAVVDPEEVAAAVVWRSGGDVEAEQDPEITAAQVEARQSFWWYLLLVALALFVIETGLSNRLAGKAS